MASMCKILEGENIAPKTAAQAKVLIGKRVTYLRESDIDRSGRGYYFPRHGIVTNAQGKNIEISENDWLSFGSLVEMILREPAPLVNSDVK